MRYNLSKLKYTSACLFIAILCAAVACDKAGRDEEVEESDTAVAGDDDGFVQIFNGTSLEGWDGDTTYWRVEDGSLVGEITPETLLERNSFIIWKGGVTKDFELKADFRITEAGNSGINYRSAPVPDLSHALMGYQADIDGKNNYTGQNYEERGRTTLAYRGEKVIINGPPTDQRTENVRDHVKKNAWTFREVTDALGSRDSLKSLIKTNDWNTCHIIAKGNRLQHYINGVLMSDVTDNDEENRKLEGLLGVQVHVGPPMKVQYRNIRLKQ